MALSISFSSIRRFDLPFPRCIESSACHSSISRAGSATMSNRRLEAFATTLLLALTPFAAPAQERAQEKETKTVEKEKPAEPTPPPPTEESSVTEHSIKIGDPTISYQTSAGTILLKNEKDEPQAIIYSP